MAAKKKDSMEDFNKLPGRIRRNIIRILGWGYFLAIVFNVIMYNIQW